MKPLECSMAWRGAPAWGTAPRAAFWVAIEQPGPWGSKPFVESRMDPELGARWQRSTLDAGGRPLLIRPPDREEARGHDVRVLVAGGLGVEPWLLATEVTDPASVWDLVLGSGPPMRAHLEAAGWLPAPPTVLVCSHASRDRCCGVLGRPLARSLEGELSGQVWECSHLGGHRFAATALLLPTGQSFASATVDDLRTAVAAAGQGRVMPGPEDRVRGESWLSAREQAAVCRVRHHTGWDRVAVTAVDDGDIVTVTVGADAVRVRVGERPAGERVVSCDGDVAPRTSWHTEIVDG